MFGLSSQLHISTTFPQNCRPHSWHYTKQSYGYPRVTFSLFILLLFLPSQNSAIDFTPLYTTKPISHNPARDWFPPTSSTVSPWIFSLPHSTYFPSSLFQISYFFFSYPQTENHIYNGKLRTHHGQHHQWPQNEKKKKSNHQLQPQKEKKFTIINTTTNHTNPPPSQPKFQTTTTNTKNPNTPTQNLQIGDPKLPTQTHKHRKPKSKRRNP